MEIALVPHKLRVKVVVVVVINVVVVITLVIVVNKQQSCIEFALTLFAALAH